VSFDDYFSTENELRKTMTSEELSEQIKAFEESMWENNMFCECGAESLKHCSCDKQERERFVEKLNMKKRAIFQQKGFEILLRQDSI